MMQLSKLLCISKAVLSLVYGPFWYNEKHYFWELLDNLASSPSKPWVIVGYFNSACSQMEKEGTTFACSSRGGLRSFVNTFGLVDLGFCGNRYIANNGRGGRANLREWLDRGMKN